MNCAEFESILADYIDGALGATGRATVEEHASVCPGCAEFMADVTGAARFLERAPDVEPPPALITGIAYQAPRGRTRDHFERQSLISRLSRKWLQPILQPRLAMGMAMTVLSFAMLERCTGVQVQHIQAADLSPVRVWAGLEGKALRVKDRAVNYYENLLFVYEVETRIKELREQQEASQYKGSRDQTSRSGRSGPNAAGSNNSNGRTPEKGNQK
jgi:anti-sigma factor RsiW